MKRNPPLHRAFSPLGTVLAALCVGLVIGRLSSPGKTFTPPTRQTSAHPTSYHAAAETAPATGAAIDPVTALPDVADGWHRLMNEASNETRTAEAAAWLARYATSAPEQALALALAEPHRARRLLWRAAALRGWAASAPEAAASWIIRQPASADRSRDIAASFAGVATTPAAAFALAKRYAEAFPEQANVHGSLLISALADAGEFTSAAGFAENGNNEQREAWTTQIFSRWSEQQPAEATHAASSLPDPGLRDVAWRAAVVNWAQNEPAALAEYARQLPAGQARAYALGEALRLWIDQDVVRASAWLDRLDPNADTDLAASLIATHSALATYRPDIALSWAESISEPTARSRTVARIVQVWSDTDPRAAAQYVESTPALLPADREGVLPGGRSTPHP